MLLVDSVYVNYGGALSLLHYLVDVLVENNIKFRLLADARCKDMFDGLSDVSYIGSSEKSRRLYYTSNQKEFSSVFCFGNVPPPIRMKIPVYTYFHNINMLTLADCRDGKQLLKFWLKRTYIRFQKRNTDEWFVQTTNTEKEVIRHLGVPNEKVKIFPFYKMPVFPKAEGKRTDYIFVGEYSGSKGHKELLEAWKLLHKRGLDYTLHLTVSKGDPFLCQLNEAITAGVHIINHGYVPFEELASLYTLCKATIYPSYNESFGLGLVEAMDAGCDVIAPNRPYVLSLCDPSESFSHITPFLIAQSVIQYEKGNSPSTKKRIRNRINELVNYIVKDGE